MQLRTPAARPLAVSLTALALVAFAACTGGRSRSGADSPAIVVDPHAPIPAEVAEALPPVTGAAAAVVASTAGAARTAVTTTAAATTSVALRAAPSSTRLAPPVPGDPMKVRIAKLPNGLTVMLSENHEAPRIRAHFTTRAGSAKDPAAATGMAHYLEHMLFKGTTRLGALDHAKEKPHLDRITELYEQLFHTTDTAERERLQKAIDTEGIAATAYQVPNELDQIYKQWGFQALNAFTNSEQTSYVVDIPSNRLEHWARVEHERLRAPVFRLFQTELEAVYEEMNRALDSPGRAAYQAMMLALFPQHPYGTQPTIGTVEHLKNPSITKMYEYYEKWYVPGNMVVTLAGDFDAEEALAVVERTLGTLPAKPVPPDPTFPIPPIDGVKRVQVTHTGDERISVVFPTVAEMHPDHDALVLCDMMLDNQQTGLINVNLTQKQAVRAAGSGPTFLIDAGFQMLYGQPNPGQTLADCEKLLLDQVALLKQGAFTDDDLRAVLTDFEVTQKRGLEDNQTRVTRMTRGFLLQAPWAHQVQSLDRLRKLTKSDIVAAANKYFGSNYVVVEKLVGTPTLPDVNKPTFTPVKLDGTKHSAFYEDLAAMPAREMEPVFAVKGRDYQVHTYPWGDLYYTENPLNDLFDLTIHVEMGTDHDPRLQYAFQLLGLAGAGDLDLLAYKRRLYALGSGVGGGAGPQESTFSASGLDANFDETVKLLRAHFTEPTGVGDDDLKKLVGSAILSRNRQKAQPQAVNAALSAFALRGEKSMFLRQPSDAEMNAYTAADLIDAISDLWKRKRIVVYAGTLAPDRVAALVGSTAGETLAPAPAREPIRHIVPTETKVLFVNSDTAQAQINILGPDGLFDVKQFPPSRVYNEYMSGGMGALVFQEVREARSLAYSVYTNYSLGRRVGDGNVMRGVLGTQADKTIEAIDVLLGLIRKLPVQPARLERNKRSIDEGYRTRRLGFRQMPGAALSWVRWGADGDPRPYNWKTATSMTMSDLTNFASRFEKMPFTITVVGPADKIDMDALSKFGPVTVVEADSLFSW